MEIDNFPPPCTTHPNKKNHHVCDFLCFLLVVWGEIHTFAMMFVTC